MAAWCPAQQPPLTETFTITGDRAATWQDSNASVATFNGPVRIQLDEATMSADGAVVWITDAPGIVPDIRFVEIALIGNATLEHSTAKRSGDRLFVSARVRGTVRMDASQRLTRDASADHLYGEASALRDQIGLSVRGEQGQWRMPRPSPFIEAPDTKRLPTTPALPVQKQVRLQMEKGYTMRMPDGTIAVIVDQGLLITIRTAPDQLTQLIADRGVVFTTIKEVGGEAKLESGEGLSDSVESVYLEGDVRILFSPKGANRPDSRLEAKQVFYEIATDRAVLTNAVLHTMDPGSHMPIIMRATTIKQLSRDEDHAEFRLQDAVLTTSSFATPSYAVASDRTYVRQVDTNEWFGMRTSFAGKQNTLELWGVPIGWLPYAGGSITERGLPLRSLDIGSSSRFGFYTRTEWGLFETIGRAPPRDLDMTYRADYLTDRGPAGGINAEYRGSSISDTTSEPNSYEGSLQSYFIYDQGVDDLGGTRNDVIPPDEMRGRLRWEHQQFLADDWQVQLRTGWISDSTFLEEYVESEFRGIEAQDTSLYVKHQRDSEAVTFLLQTQPNNVVSTQEFAQENYEIERLPEVGYHRIADDLGTGTLTLYSNNSVSRLGFDPNSDSFPEMGYNPSLPSSAYFPYYAGLPSTGYTGQPDDYVNRGDFREEVALPLTIDRFRVQPYLMGRYTGYDNSPDGHSIQRGLAGGGVRMTTSFWNVDDDVQSEMWDIHRMRHVIEPELHLFGSVSGTQRDEVYVFDEQVDAINDITAAQLALRQRWQTKRGGSSKWRSVDFLTWNLEANFFGNEPDEAFLRPEGFRGLFFSSMPETSVPRDSVNSEEIWRISDSTVIMSDQQYSLVSNDLATASVGIAARRGERITYYIGNRYINELNSNIVSFMLNYELSTRYSLGMNQAYDYGENERVTSGFSAIRRFDRFFVALTLTVDDQSNDTGMFISVRPNSSQTGISSAGLPSVFGQ